LVRWRKLVREGKGVLFNARDIDVFDWKLNDNDPAGCDSRCQMIGGDLRAIHLEDTSRQPTAFIAKKSAPHLRLPFFHDVQHRHGHFIVGAGLSNALIW